MSYLMIFLPIMLVSWFVSYMLRKRFREYSEIPLYSGMSGAEVVEKMLRDHNIYDVQLTCIEGTLTDHYNPTDKTINLSQAVYYGRNAAAAAVAAHECGHAVQHATAYSFLRFRSSMVPALSIASNYMSWILLAGVLLLNYTSVPLALGVGLFALTTLFSFITLPVEFDASQRALLWIERAGVVTASEYKLSKNALWWAAMTYVVAALGSLATLIHYGLLLLGGNDD